LLDRTVVEEGAPLDNNVDLLLNCNIFRYILDDVASNQIETFEG